MSDRYVRLEDGTVWPVDVPNERENTVGWMLRCAAAHMTRSDELVAASIVDTYTALTSSEVTQQTAIDMLKKARRARRAALSAPKEDRCPTCRSQERSVLRGVCFIRDSTPQSEPDPWHSAPKEG